VAYEWDRLPQRLELFGYSFLYETLRADRGLKSSVWIMHRARSHTLKFLRGRELMNGTFRSEP
jgi:hypothetical protein